jgi:hypothetical protein
MTNWNGFEECGRDIIDVILPSFPGGIEKNHENPDSIHPVSRPIF